MGSGYNICFVLGYQADDKTEIHRKLVDLFGVGGVVSRDQEGCVLNFNIETNYGILYLSRDSGVLILDITGTTEAGGIISFVVKPDTIITSVDIENIHKKLRDSSVIRSDKPWFFSFESYFGDDFKYEQWADR